MAILKPYITGKYSEKRKKKQPTGIPKPKYKLSVGPFFTFSLQKGGTIQPSCPLSVTPLLFTQYETTWVVRIRLCKLVGIPRNRYGLFLASEEVLSSKLYLLR